MQDGESPELFTLGQRLKAARELRRLTLDAIEEATHIRKTYLQAIEQGRAGDLPGEVFLRGFMRTYANHLVLDGAALVEDYKRALQQRQGDAEEWPEGTAPGGGSARQPLRQRRTRSRRRGDDRVALWALAVVVLAAGAWVVHAVASGHRTTPADARPQPPAAKSSTSRASATASSSAASAAASSSVSQPRPSGPKVLVAYGLTSQGWEGTYTVTGATGLQVGITVNAPCWTERRVDGVLMAPDLTLGQNGVQTVTWTAKSSLQVKVGNAPAITALRIDGQPVETVPAPFDQQPGWLMFTLG